jgi:hypothetical protein
VICVYLAVIGLHDEFSQSFNSWVLVLPIPEGAGRESSITKVDICNITHTFNLKSRKPEGTTGVGAEIVARLFDSPLEFAVCGCPAFLMQRV